MDVHFRMQLVGKVHHKYIVTALVTAGADVNLAKKVKSVTCTYNPIDAY